MNIENYKKIKEMVDGFDPLQRDMFFDGVFMVLNMVNNEAHGQDLKMRDRHAIDEFWTLVEMGASVDIVKRGFNFKRGK